MTTTESGRTRVFAARRIITMDDARPDATHVAVRDGRITMVGNAEDVTTWGDVDIVDTFGDKVLIPGLVEAHCHLMEGAMWEAVYVGYYDRRDPQGRLWRGLRTLDQVLDRLFTAEAALGKKAGPLLAWGFDPILFGTQRLTVRELDQVSASRPIVVLHASVHLMNVNSVMLDLAGIDEDSEIEGVHKDASGQPTGELQEFAAMYPVYKIIGSALSLAAGEKPEAIWNFGRVAQLAGVTTATDLVNDLAPLGMSTLRRVTDSPDYPVRVIPAFAPQHSSQGGPATVLEAIAGNTDRLRFGPVKFIVDGSIQGFTARLRAPYANGQPNGLWLIPPAQLVELFTPFHEAGLQMHIHTNGDEATEVVLDALETILAANPRTDHRHTLQHCQMASPDQLARAARLGLCINFFINHLYYWGDAHHDQTVGPARAEKMNPAGSARRLGIPFSLHSDAPITPLSPLFTAWCAVQRQTASGRVLGHDERLPVMDALHAVTLGAAYTLRMDHLIGSITPGKHADFAVLEDDPLALLPERLRDVHVWGTVLGGRVFQAPAR